MRATFFVTTISALTAQGLLAIELGTSSTAMTNDSNVVDALSLTQVDSYLDTEDFAGAKAEAE